VHGLLSRSAETIDAHAGDLDGQAGGEGRAAGDVEALLTDGHHTAEDDVVDQLGIETGARHRGAQGEGGELLRVHVVEHAAFLLATGGADSVDDHGGAGHESSSSGRLTFMSTIARRRRRRNPDRDARPGQTTKSSADPRPSTSTRA
jgi:hypothetical protein